MGELVPLTDGAESEASIEGRRARARRAERIQQAWNDFGIADELSERRVFQVTLYTANEFSVRLAFRSIEKAKASPASEGVSVVAKSLGDSLGTQECFPTEFQATQVEDALLHLHYIKEYLDANKTNSLTVGWLNDRGVFGNNACASINKSGPQVRDFPAAHLLTFKGISRIDPPRWFLMRMLAVPVLLQAAGYVRDRSSEIMAAQEAAARETLLAKGFSPDMVREASDNPAIKRALRILGASKNAL